MSEFVFLPTPQSSRHCPTIIFSHGLNQSSFFSKLCHLLTNLFHGWSFLVPSFCIQCFLTFHLTEIWENTNKWHIARLISSFKPWLEESLKSKLFKSLIFLTGVKDSISICVGAHDRCRKPLILILLLLLHGPNCSYVGLLMGWVNTRLCFAALLT